MNTDVFALTLREFVSQRRSLFILLLAVVPVGLAALSQVGDSNDQQDFAVNFLLDGVLITRILPLACLIVGTAAVGSEIEDGTIVYLLAKPISRRSIMFAKFAASALLCAALIVPATLISGAIGMQGIPGEGVVLGFGAASAVGVVAYTAGFMLLSIATSRALLIGLGYVFIWEGLISGLFGGTAYLSIRHYCLGIADAISTVDKDLLSAELGGAESVLLAAAVTTGALWMAVRWLETLELTESE